MRHLVFAALCACSAPAGPSAPPVPTPHVPVRSQDVVVTITGTRVVMNGIEVSARPMVSDLVAVFGKWDRRWDQGGRVVVYTWDRIGLLVYEPHDGRATAVTFAYKPLKQVFDPRIYFSGSITVDGNRFSANTALATVKQWPGATTPYSPSSVVFDKSDIHVFTQEEQPPAGTVDLVEISFWQKAEAADHEPDSCGPRPLVSACRAGDARTCTRIALICQTGATGDKDPDRALVYAKLGCDGGDGIACRIVGNMFGAGYGTKASPTDARAAYKKACSLGDAVGCERSR